MLQRQITQQKKNTGNSKPTSHKDWLNNDKLAISIYENKYRYKNETLDEFLDRVSGGDQELRRLIFEKKFILGGRILANRGTGRKSTTMNCYSEGYVGDSLDDIMQVATNIAKTYKAHGGQGLSLSKIRPKGCGVSNGDFLSDGIEPFIEMYNTITGAISQGNARRGALLISLDAWHAEADRFIRIKSESGKVKNANLSLEIDDEFMKCVEDYYANGEIKTVHKVCSFEGNEFEYDVTPINLYKLMMQKAWEWGEPGCLFVNQLRNYNLMEFVDEYQIETTNPCLHPDTLVQTVNGPVKIKDIDRPVMVYCMNEDRTLSIRESSPSFVSKENAETIEVKLSNGIGIKMTPDHKVYVNNKGWIEAKNLQIKDRVVTFDTYTINEKCSRDNIYVTSITPSEVTDVYDIQVEGYHNFLANGVIVHNCGECSPQYNNLVKSVKPKSTIWQYRVRTDQRRM